MKFKNGDKVKCSNSLLSTLSPCYAIVMKNVGEIVDAFYTKDISLVKFGKNTIFGIAKSELRLIKNKQLLFDFMNEEKYCDE